MGRTWALEHLLGFNITFGSIQHVKIRLVSSSVGRGKFAAKLYRIFAFSFFETVELLENVENACDTPSIFLMIQAFTFSLVHYQFPAGTF